MHADLFDYQRVGARWLSAPSNAHAILADEMGVGKTATAIAAADELQAQSILVICPGIARTNWVRELERWQTMPRVVGAVYSSKVLPLGSAIIAGYSSLQSEPILRWLLGRHWDVLILDEAHFGKNSAAWRTRALYGNKCDARFGLASRAKRTWLLSGTLMPNHAGELWTHCHALFPDVAQGLDYEDWLREYCVFARGTERVVGNRNGEKLVKLLRPHVLRRTAAQVQPHLPPCRFNQVIVRPDKLPPKSVEIEETEIIVRAALAKSSKDRTDESRQAIAALDEIHLATLRKWTGIAKAPAVAEYLRMDLAAGMKKCVVFAVHRDVIQTLADALPGSAVIHGDISQKKRDQAIDAFQGRNAGWNPRVMICNIDIASTALTLTAADNVVFAESSWVPKDLQQAIKRVHRQGQTKPVLARLFSLQGSVDEQIGARLVQKARITAIFNQAIAA